ncbi:DUF2569 domain-containing protein [Erwinia tasmaniensis]|uniref:Inner membrane protein YdgK n=1 Tax=Erwinia tasmaniensis (strain DSM 17950 / CFBP 7177 / CIP 109463 / NCPPB 4357 / Et1/99) TaxID=465817 RepID=B2VER3_ERWT9|nr:DUF2569 domain-containing protein [Erwinia tasmaniensis]CAO96819.1 Putative inner membrane protein YdgK [Erwinia tasmaniensis Et1/99]
MAVDPQTRLGGWLLVPLAWLIMTLLTSALVMAMYFSALFDPAMRHALFTPPHGALVQWAASLLTSAVVWGYSAWVTWIFCKRSRRLPRHYIIWLLLSVILAIKTFAFSPVTDAAAIRMLLIALLAASVLVPYFRRSQRVKATFIEP